MLVKTWIFEDNLRPFLQTLAWLVDYAFSEEDWMAISYEIEDPDDDEKRSTQYRFEGQKLPTKISIDRDATTSTVAVVVDIVDDLANAVKTAGSIFSTYRVI